MSQHSFRVFLSEHENGNVSGVLLRQWSSIFEGAPPSAYATSESAVLSILESALVKIVALDDDGLERYLWDEDFEVSKARLLVHPRTTVDKLEVVGAGTIPLQLSYAWTELKNKALRIMLPRFDWWIVVEERSCIEDALNVAVAGAFLGEDPRWVYEYREGKNERVISFRPSLIKKSRKLKRYLSWGSNDDDKKSIYAVCDDWVELAKRKEFAEPVETQATASVMSLLNAQRPRSVLLVGGSGVGKTACIQSVAYSFSRMPEARVFWATTSERILAGMKYVGMWQERCIQVAKALEEEDEPIFLGHLLGWVQEQSDGGALIDAFLEGAKEGRIVLAAECTPEAFALCQRLRPDVLAHFDVVKLEEPDRSFTVHLLKRASAHLSPTPLLLHPQAWSVLLSLLQAFDKGQLFPGRAFRFLHWLSREQGGIRREEVRPHDITEAFSRFRGLPLAMLSEKMSFTQKTLETALQQKVVGQPKAVEAAAGIMARFKARVQDPNRPAGVLFFVGPSGVGKTQLAKAMSEVLFGNNAEGTALSRRLVRIDFSEFLTPFSGSRLLDGRAGTQSLVERVRNEPFSIVLIDEVEKAHPAVHDILLGILGEGRATNSKGQLVDFSSTIIVMTSNVGASEKSVSGFGSGRDEKFHESSSPAVRRAFRPEFFARIDAVVPFTSLSIDDVVHVVHMELKKVGRMRGLSERNVSVWASDLAAAHLAEKGTDKTYGVRPLVRTIEEQIVTPLAIRLAAGETLTSKVWVVTKEEEVRARALGDVVVLV